MTGLYEKWMTAWETRLTERDTNRVVRPFEWGVEWTRHWPLVTTPTPAKAARVGDPVNGNFPGEGQASKLEEFENSSLKNGPNPNTRSFTRASRTGLAHHAQEQARDGHPENVREPSLAQDDRLKRDGRESQSDLEGAHRDYILALNQNIVERSEEFFSYATPRDFRLEQRPVEVFATRSDPTRADRKTDARHRKRSAEFLRFTSPARTPYEENNLANARWFPAPEKKRTKKAVVVLPHWNSDALSHNALCRALNWFGISALRLSMPYHDIRRPKELERADYAVSANVGRTIDAARQAVIDLRCCLDWLEQQGYSEFGVLGTSLGSCYAFIASAHDERLRVNVFNHASTYFADVVWLGQSTRHIRSGVEQAIALEDLRNAWLAISPTSYVELFAARKKASLVIHARYDLTFPPQFSRQVVAEFASRKFDFEEVELPCGHYTTGETPFKFLDAYHIVKFMVRRLGKKLQIAD